MWILFKNTQRVQIPEEHKVIIENVRIAVMPAKCEELLRALSAWAGPTAVEPGCLSCRILQENSAPQAFWYQAHWKTQADLLRHLRTEHYRKLLGLMELGTIRPVVEFHTVTDIQGLDLIERTRKV
jgi:quinol monooxygenase YgiN